MTITIQGHELTEAERSVYERAADRSRTAYVRKHGGPAVDVADYRTGGDWRSDKAREVAVGMVRAAAEEWRAEHLERREAAAVRAGETAVVKRLRQLADVFGDSEAAARLEVLKPAKVTRRPAAGKATRKPVARKAGKPAVAPVVETPAPVDVPAAEVPAAEVPAADVWAPEVRHHGAEVRIGASVTTGPLCVMADRVTWADVRITPGTMTCDACAEVLARLEGDAPAPAADVTVYGPDGRAICSVPNLAPVDVPAAPTATVPDTVPAPMPRMTRAARRISNRDLAARMRAAGIAITPESWAAAKAGELEGIGA
jgi:hypothetical protein